MSVRIELGQFQYVEKRRAHRLHGKKELAVRFTWSLHVDVPGGEVAEFCVDGCLCWYGSHGFVWTFPITHTTEGAGRRFGMRVMYANPYLYNITRDGLLANEKLMRPVKEHHEELVQLYRSMKGASVAGVYQDKIPDIITVNPGNKKPIMVLKGE